MLLISIHPFIDSAPRNHAESNKKGEQMDSLPIATSDIDQSLQYPDALQVLVRSLD